MLGLFTYFLFTAVAPPSVREPFGAGVLPQTRQENGDMTHFEKVRARFGIEFRLPSFEDNTSGSWPVYLSYLAQNGLRKTENLDLSEIMRSFSSGEEREHFFKQFKTDVAAFFEDLYTYLTKYQDPKRRITKRSEKLVIVNRSLNWGGLLLGAVLAGTTSYTSGFYSTIVATLSAAIADTLGSRLKSKLDLAFKRRKEVDEALSTILLRYGKPEYKAIHLMFVRAICNALNYTGAKKYRDKLLSTWNAGLKFNFPDYSHAETPAEVPVPDDP